jgi:hypothetical protein
MTPRFFVLIAVAAALFRVTGAAGATEKSSRRSLLPTSPDECSAKGWPHAGGV